jgi:alanyl-tRNA synthetase
MTHRIYYTDPACRTFEAVVTRVFEHDRRLAVTLDRTAFYPTSGGQPFDTGRLGTVSVVETIDVESDPVHIVSGPLAEGARVEGAVDWPRRHDHMQQHTGQHLLSAAFDRLFGNPTMSFHMGAEQSTIDLARDVSASEIEKAVDEANGVVWENRPVSIRFVSQEEAARLALRKEPGRGGTLRLIEIEGFDLSACGGTHVEHTGEVGVIGVLGSERFRGGARVVFVCGARCVRALRVYRDAVAGSVRALSVLPAELPAAVERLMADSKDARKTIKRLQETVAVHDASRLVAEAPRIGGVRAVVQILDGWDAAGLKAIAAAGVTGEPACLILLNSSSIVVARSSGVPVDASALLARLTVRFGGRGGGKPDLAQGGGLAGSPEDIASSARELLESFLR